MLQSHDEVLKVSSGEEVNPYQADTSTGFNSRVEESVGERPEKLTRVRLVQFHKNPNEPMVRLHVYALRDLLSLILNENKFSFFICENELTSMTFLSSLTFFRIR